MYSDYSSSLVSHIYSYHIGQFMLSIWARFKAKNRSLCIINESIIVWRLKNLVQPVKMVLLSHGNTCLTRVYYPTPRPLHSNGSGRYAIYTCLVEYFKFRGSLRALYIHVCNKITTLISCHMAHLPMFFICMNNSIQWFINNPYNFN